ncbi:lipopolysaccharide heptosyltransferase I [Eikenella sp. Marseille-P7795]|uniref:lipopolysaccharide heptosyltransferase I n=1 Tax=Eikenella sp. Marseille-P7795 TaxID=2866577 RepID=UPI001CE439BD|nr:lipopolysaccharide heptosyltransferase I [Eikenella sp. Marseille-P7795]
MKILLVRLSSMGDLIHTLPAVQDLARHCPQVELHWLAEAGFADIARLHPFVRKVIPMRWRQWRKRLFAAETRRQMRALKQELAGGGYDFVLDSQGLIKSAWFARWAGAPVKGLDKHSAREGWAAAFYAERFQVAKGRDAVWRNRELFAQVFGYCFDGAPNFGVRVPEAAAVQGLPENYRVALHATSRDSKLWPQQHWVELLNRLHAADGAAVWLPWGNEAERQRALALAWQVAGAQVPAERLGLLQAAYVLRGAHSVIGVDTGLLHLANALDKPLVGIYTDSDPVKTGVQTSAWARNVGGVGALPAVEEVLDRVCSVEQAAAEA